MRNQIAVARASEGKIGVVLEEADNSAGNHDAKLLLIVVRRQPERQTLASQKLQQQPVDPLGILHVGHMRRTRNHLRPGASHIALQ